VPLAELELADAYTERYLAAPRTDGPAHPVGHRRPMCSPSCSAGSRWSQGLGVRPRQRAGTPLTRGSELPPRRVRVEHRAGENPAERRDPSDHGLLVELVEIEAEGAGEFAGRHEVHVPDEATAEISAL
jgi:hypothetical protein